MAFPLASGFSPLEYTLSFLSPFWAEVRCLGAGQGRDREDSKTRKEPDPQDSVIAHLTGEWERGFQPPSLTFLTVAPK